MSGIGGVQHFSISQPEGGKFNVKVENNKGNEGNNNINPTQLAAGLNTALGLTPPNVLTPEIVEGLETTNFNGTEPPTDGTSILDRLLDGVSLINDVQGDKCFSTEGKAAVAQALQAWIGATDEPVKITALATLKKLLADDAKVGEKDESPAVWTIITTDGVKKHDNIDGFRAALNIQTTPEPPKNTLIPVMSLGTFAEKATAKKLTNEDYDKLPDEVKDLFEKDCSLSNEERIILLNELGELGYFGLLDDYSENKKGIFVASGLSLGVTGNAFVREFFNDIPPTITTQSLKNAISTLAFSLDVAKATTSTDSKKFIGDFLMATSYSRRTVSQSVDAAASNLATKLSSEANEVTAEQLKALAKTFSERLANSQSSTMNEFVGTVSGSKFQVTLSSDNKNIEISFKVGDNFKKFVSVKKEDWEHFVKFVKGKEDKELWLLNFLEVMQQGKVDEGITIYSGDKVETVTDITESLQTAVGGISGLKVEQIGFSSSDSSGKTNETQIKCFKLMDFKMNNITRGMDGIVQGLTAKIGETHHVVVARDAGDKDDSKYDFYLAEMNNQQKIKDVSALTGLQKITFEMGNGATATKEVTVIGAPDFTSTGQAARAGGEDGATGNINSGNDAKVNQNNEALVGGEDGEDGTKVLGITGSPSGGVPQNDDKLEVNYKECDIGVLSELIKKTSKEELGRIQSENKETMVSAMLKGRKKEGVIEILNNISKDKCGIVLINVDDCLPELAKEWLLKNDNLKTVLQGDLVGFCDIYSQIKKCTKTADDIKDSLKAKIIESLKDINNVSQGEDLRVLLRTIDYAEGDQGYVEEINKGLSNEFKESFLSKMQHQGTNTFLSELVRLNHLK